MTTSPTAGAPAAKMLIMDSLDLFFAKTLLSGKGSAQQEQCLASSMSLFREGHLCVKKQDLELPSSLISEGKDLFPQTPLVRHGDRIYLQKNWVYETAILQHLNRLRSSQPTPLFDPAVFREALQQAKLLPEQAEALQTAFEQPFFVLCGGPGTGKTYTAVQFIRLLLASLQKGEKLHLTIAAPTGKAAMHLQKTLLSGENLSPSLRVEATTLHRLLRLQPGENKLFTGRRIDADLVLIDEASMIDVPLLAHLLEAVGEGTRLFLMGDPNQLPPVENPSLFPELASLFGVHLKRCMRTEEGPLTELAEAFRSNDIEEMMRLLKEQKLDWRFDATLGSRLFEQIQPIVSSERPDPQACLDHYASFRVLNALRQGPFGASQLNRQIAQIAEKKEGQWQALPILITTNDPHSGLYNGTTGVLIRQNRGEEKAYFPGRLEGMTQLPPFEIAFCLSIYKSQGSEFEEVLALFPPGSENFGKESLYTAVTRAKKRFHWLGEEEVLRKMAARSPQKVSGLLERLQVIP